MAKTNKPPQESAPPAPAPTADDQIEWPVTTTPPDVSQWKVENITNQMVSLNILGRLHQIRAKGFHLISAATEADLGHDVVVKKRQKSIKVTRFIQPNVQY